METWDDALRDLREEFLGGAIKRLGRIEELLARLTESPDASLVRELRRHFHAFTGSGSTFGLPEVTAAGREGEELCAGLSARDGALDAEEAARFGHLVEALRGHLSAAVAAAERRL